MACNATVQHTPEPDGRATPEMTRPPVPLSAAVAGSALLLAGCVTSPDLDGDPGHLVAAESPRAPVAAGAAESAAASVRALGTDLYAILGRDDGNVVFSPYSAAVALAMSRAGAVGQTASEMDQVLHAGPGALDPGFNALDQALAERPGEFQLPGADTPVELVLTMANQLWGQEGSRFHDHFLTNLAGNYGTGVRVVDFVDASEDARSSINHWVSDQTRERIPELIPAGVLNELTRLVLTNAIYLKAPWHAPFRPAATAAGTFTRLDGSTVQAQMMRLSERLGYTAGDGFAAVDLPYAGRQLSMLVIVPDEGAFSGFETGLDADRLQAIVNGLASTQVNLGFPRFEFRTQAALAGALRELGMPTAFTDAADFSAMGPDGDDWVIQDVLHEAFISVDEEGTEAAAATAVVMGVTSAPLEPVVLNVDRPFLFVIRDVPTGAILFMGRVVDPTV